MSINIFVIFYCEFLADIAFFIEQYRVLCPFPTGEAADSTSAIFAARIKEEANFKLYLGIMITEMFELRPSRKFYRENSRCRTDNDVCVCNLIREIREDRDASDEDNRDG